MLAWLEELVERGRADNDTNTGAAAGGDHVGELGAVAALGGEDVRYRLVVGPPLRA